LAGPAAVCGVRCRLVLCAGASRADPRPGGGDASPDIDKVTYVVDRQRALNRLRTLPGGDAFEPLIASRGEGIEELWQAYSADDDQWHAARARLKEAIQAFTAVVRREIQH
jgi:hypothetical protein